MRKRPEYEVVLGFGSNLPDSHGRGPRALVEAAGKDIEGFLRDVRLSSAYETDPWFPPDPEFSHLGKQPRFVNAAAAGFFPGSPRDLLFRINDLEAAYGRDRRREIRWGERILDIDILLFGDMVIRQDDLVIPHPRLRERAFALAPLLELLPDVRDPVSGVFFKDIFRELGGAGVTVLPQ